MRELRIDLDMDAGADQQAKVVGGTNAYISSP